MSANAHASISRGAVIVRAAEAKDEARWRDLWRDYLVFYRQDLAPDITDHTWRRILDPASPVFARMAIDDGEAVGFAVAVLHEGSWMPTPICYLEDLFVMPLLRGAGVGRALIQDLQSLARTNGWSRLYWHAGADNRRARGLYDQFAEADLVVRYTLPFV